MAKTIKAWAVIYGDGLGFRGNAGIAEIFRGKPTAEYEAKIHKGECVPCTITYESTPSTV